MSRVFWFFVYVYRVYGVGVLCVYICSCVLEYSVFFFLSLGMKSGGEYGGFFGRVSCSFFLVVRRGEFG